MSDNIATLAIKVRADIGQLRQGLGHAKRELDKFERSIRSSGVRIEEETSKWGLIRAFKRGKEIGTKFGDDLASSLTSGKLKSTFDYFSKRQILSTQKRSGFERGFIPDLERIDKLTKSIGTNLYNTSKTSFNTLTSTLNGAFNRSKQGIGSIGQFFVPETLRTQIRGLTKDVDVLGKLALFAATGLGTLAPLVGLGMRAFQGLDAVFNRFPRTLRNLFNQTSSTASNSIIRNISRVGQIVGIQLPKMIWNKLATIGVPSGRDFGSRFTRGIEYGWSKLTRRKIPFRFDENTSQSAFQLGGGFKPNMAANIARITDTFGFKNLMLNTSKMSYLISELQKKRNVGPNTKTGKDIEEQIRSGLTLESVYKRIGDSLRSIKRTDIWEGFKRNGASGLNSLRQAGKWLITKRDISKPNPLNPLATPPPIMRSPLGQGFGGFIAYQALKVKALSYGLKQLPMLARGSYAAFSTFGSVMSGALSRTFNLFQTLNPFELFTRSILAFKTTAVLAIGAVMYESIKLSGEFEQFKVGFEALTGSAQLGQKTFAEMTSFAAKTPFSIKEVLAASQMLLGYGTEAAQLYPTLKMIGDVTSAIGNDYVNLQHVTYLFGTMQQQGHIFTRDVNQLANIGIPIYEALATVLKVDKQSIQGMVEAGKVGFPEMAKAMENITKPGSKFFGFMEKQSRTLLGLWRNLMDNLQIAGAKFGDVLVKEFGLKDLISKATGMTQNSDEFFYKYKNEIKDLTDGIKSMTGYAISFGLHLAAAFRVALDLAKAMFPETAKSMEQLAKGGINIELSWTKAKITIMEAFETIALGFAKMIDSILNAMHTVFGSTMKTLRDINPLAKDRATYQDVYDTNTMGLRKIHENISVLDRRIEGLKREGFEGGIVDTEQRKRDILFDTFKQLLPQAYNKINKERGFIDFEAPKSVTDEVSKFFWLQRNNQKEGIRLEEQRMQEYRQGMKDSEEYGNKVLSELFGGIIPKAMRQFKASEIQEMYDKIHDPAELAGFVGGSTIPALAFTKAMTEVDKINKNYSGPAGLPISSIDDPETRKFKVPFQPITSEMQTLIDKLKLEKTPLQELTDTIHNLNVPYVFGKITPELHAQGTLDAYKKASERLGDNTIQFAAPAYKGSAEALKIEAEAKAGMFNMSMAERIARINEDALEEQKVHTGLLKELIGLNRINDPQVALGGLVGGLAWGPP